jgi:agmatinase
MEVMTQDDLTFMGTPLRTPGGAGAALFGAPHGTAYPGIDNSVHADAARAIRRAASVDRDFAGHWDFDLDGVLLGGGGFRFADLGDLATAPLEANANRAMIEAQTREVLAAGAVPLMIGGDDSTPIPFVAAFSEHGPVTIVQIDAHIDWRDERYGERLGFSSTMRRASEMAHVGSIVQIGARGLGSARETEVRAALAWGARLITARDIHDRGVAAALDHVPPGSRCLVTLDCDALDQSVMPAVAYPSPGGLAFLQVLALIEGVAAKARIVGFDMVEFVPARDPTGIAAFAAGRILCNVIGRLARASGSIDSPQPP